MLIRILYVSRAVGPQTTALTGSILTASLEHNKLHGITGVLCQGQGFFLQVLEGDRSAVNRLYGRILADKRHQDVEILLMEEITERSFGNWSMAHVHLSDMDPMVTLKLPEFAPYSATGAQAMALITELLASGHPITRPVL